MSMTLEQAEKTLDQHAFLGGNLPTQDDTQFFQSLKSVPDKKNFPNVYFYFCTLSNFTQVAMAGFKGQVKKTEVKQEQPKKKEDDDIDLFGDDDEADKEAQEKLVQKQKEQQAASQKTKKVVIAKSIIVFDVKVYEQEQDLKALAEKIFAEIQIDGLVWNKDIKILPVAFGMMKLQLGCVVEDAKVGTDDIFERIEAWEDEVQSCDIVTFQKL